MHNHIALDVLLAAQGGTCAVTGSECCTYIPDNSEEIDNLAGRIKAEGAKYHDYNRGWNFGSWLEKMFGGWGAWILHILFIGLMIFVTIVVIIMCIGVIIGVYERKFATVTTMVAHEVSLDQPSLGIYGDPEDPEDPENPENEEHSIELSRDTVTVESYGKCKNTDTRAFGTDKNPFERIQQLLLKNQKQMDDYDEEIWNDRDTFKTSGGK